jgi:hypothetical protein
MNNVFNLEIYLRNKINDFCLVESPKRPSSSDDVNTNVEIVIKPSQFILIEDKTNNNSNCLVLNVSFNLLKSKIYFLKIKVYNVNAFD